MAINIKFEGPGHTAIVTGAASGIGNAIAKQFAEAGANVIASDFDEAVTSVFDALPIDVSSRIRPLIVDVSVEAEIETMVSECLSQFGQVNTLVNNAGLGGAYGSVTNLDLKDWRDTYAVLVEGVLLGTKYATKAMEQQEGGGSIINIASAAGLASGVGPLAYSSAKAALVSMTANTALELADRRIRVNAVCPGAILTPMFSSSKGKAAVEVAQPWPEFGKPDDVANLVLFLSSECSKFITGQAYVVDGGLLAAGTRFRELTGMMPTQQGFAGARKSAPIEHES